MLPATSQPDGSSPWLSVSFPQPTQANSFSMSSSLRYLGQAARVLRSPSSAPRYLTPSLRRGNATAVEAPSGKHWAREEVQEVYDSPLMDLIFRAVRPFLPAKDDPPQFQADQLVGLGVGAQAQPPAGPNPALHAAEHQNGRMRRGLLVLCSECAVRGQGRLEGREAE